MMSAVSVLQRLLQSARRRQIAIGVLVGLPLPAAVALIAMRLHGVAGLAALLTGVSIVIALAWRMAARLDDVWLARRLDARMPALEDSAALLHADPVRLSRLQTLQRSRIEHRLITSEPPDLRAPWPHRVLLSSWGLGIAASTVALVWTSAPMTPARSGIDAAAPAVAAPTATRIVRPRLRIQPPVYTGLPTRTEPALETRLPEGARVHWTLRLDPDPNAATLVFHDGSRLDLVRSGANWTASRVLRASALYRLAVQGAPKAEDRLYRLDVVADRTPQIRVLQPDRSLVSVERGQRSWSLIFEASDDYGLIDARLVTTHAQGSGENLSFKERSIELAGAGATTRKRYAHEVDLDALGMAAGDDLVAQLRVDDNRRPQPRTARSASVILRWPSQAGGESSAVEGLIHRTLPAYFRSQRQIIIDSEALVAQRLRLDRPGFAARSDTIGVDQRVLRLRYGQFLGEEEEDGAHPPAQEARFGDAGAVLEDYGHIHDHPEAATLLDPQTKRLLRSALDQMWRAQLHLHQGHPELALPYEYRALDFIKRVQQAERIYLARVGLELPPIDRSRRLSGDRSGLRDRRDGLSAAPADAALLAEFWRSLDVRQQVAGSKSGSDARRRVHRSMPDFEAIERWVLAHEAQLPDPLELLAALDAVRRDRRCQACTRRLKIALWPLLPTPAASTESRRAADRAGQAYLDALQRERTQ